MKIGSRDRKCQPHWKPTVLVLKKLLDHLISVPFPLTPFSAILFTLKRNRPQRIVCKSLNYRGQVVKASMFQDVKKNVDKKRKTTSNQVPATSEKTDPQPKYKLTHRLDVFHV